MSAGNTPSTHVLHFDLVSPHKVPSKRYDQLESDVNGLTLVSSATIDRANGTMRVVPDMEGVHPERVEHKIGFLRDEIRDLVNSRAGAIRIQQANGQHRGVSSPSTMGRGGR